MPTTPNGLPYPPATDPPNGPLQIQQLAEALDPLAKKSAWTNLAMNTNPAVTGTLRYQQLGYWVVVDVNVAVAGNIAAGAIVTISAGLVLPAAVRPSKVLYSSGYFTGFQGSILIGNSGDIAATHNSGAARAGVIGHVVYPIGI